MNGGLPHYTVEVGAGTVVAFLVDTPLAALPAPSAVTAATVLGEGLMGGAVTDHRRALEAYAELRGLGVERAGTETVLVAPDGRLSVELDDQGRITAMNGSFGPAA